MNRRILTLLCSSILAICLVGFVPRHSTQEVHQSKGTEVTSPDSKLTGRAKFEAGSKFDGTTGQALGSASSPTPGGTGTGTGGIGGYYPISVIADSYSITQDPSNTVAATAAQDNTSFTVAGCVDFPDGITTSPQQSGLDDSSAIFEFVWSAASGWTTIHFSVFDTPTYSLDLKNYTDNLGTYSLSSGGENSYNLSGNFDYTPDTPVIELVTPDPNDLADSRIITIDEVYEDEEGYYHAFWTYEAPYQPMVHVSVNGSLPSDGSRDELMGTAGVVIAGLLFGAGEPAGHP